jgi:hypothetical protein
MSPYLSACHPNRDVVIHDGAVEQQQRGARSVAVLDAIGRGQR